jgi:CheY-like chemotaxis protein
VDDDAPIRRMLERTLAAEGYRVDTAADGGAALAALERSIPDLVLLDVAMPGVDGLAVSRRARARGLATPILLLTARDTVTDRVNGLDAGADDYLVKPFATEELLARVRALLRRGREPAELLACGDLVFEVATRTARRAGREIALSEREADLRAVAPQPAPRREEGDRSGAGLGQRPRSDLEQRRPLHLVPPPQARRAVVDRDGARHRLRARALTVGSLLGRSVLAARRAPRRCPS